MELVALIVHQQHLALPDLIYLAADHLTDLILILLIEGVVLKFEDLRSQCLAQVQDSTAAELLEVHLLRNLLTHLVVGLNLLSLGEGNLLVLIHHLIVGYHHTVTVNFKVTLVRVHDHVKVLVRAIDFGNDVTEALLEHTHQRGAVDVLVLFKFLKGLNHRGTFRIFLNCH